MLFSSSAWILDAASDLPGVLVSLRGYGVQALRARCEALLAAGRQVGSPAPSRCKSRAHLVRHADTSQCLTVCVTLAGTQRGLGQDLREPDCRTWCHVSSGDAVYPGFRTLGCSDLTWGARSLWWAT